MTAASRPLRVLVALPGAELYGSDRVAAQTVQALIEAGHEVTVTSPTAGPLLPRLTGLGARVAVCPAPVVRRSGLTPRGALALGTAVVAATPAMWRLLRWARPDVVVVNTLVVPFWIGLARVARVPVVCHVHEAEARRSGAVRRVLAAPLRLAATVVVNSDTTRAVLAGTHARLAARAVLVRNPVAGPPGPPAPADHTGAARIVYAGRLSARKGVDVAVAAVGLLLERGHDVRLDLVGEAFAGQEDFVARLREQARRPPLAGRVSFHGFEPDVWRRLAAATVVVVPSVADESYGNAAVEAALAARPVVVSAQPGLLEATAGYRGAVRVDPGDAAALADGLARVLDDPAGYDAGALADAGLAGRRNAPERYRREMERTVRDVVARPRHR